MKKKIGLILGGIFLFSLVLVGVVMAALEETSTDATVTVNTFVDISITDTAPDGFNFGGAGLNPGTTNNKEDSQVDVTSVTPAVTITRQATSNVDVKVRLKGLDFTGGTILIGNVDYDDDGIVDELLILPAVTETDLPQNSMTINYPTEALCYINIRKS